jgi:hypothetical protein
MGRDPRPHQNGYSCEAIDGYSSEATPEWLQAIDARGQPTWLELREETRMATGSMRPLEWIELRGVSC